jgi:DNA-binding GntR family transcriptional regulator
VSPRPATAPPRNRTRNKQNEWRPTAAASAARTVESPQSLGTRAPSQAEATHATLLDLIVSMQLPPGAHLSEQDLSRRTGFGRTPVREALQRLEIEGFCTILPRRGILVAALDLNYQTEVWEMRMELEPAAARMAAERRTDEDVNRLRGILAEISDAVSGGHDHFAATRAIDERLHLEIAADSKNELLAQHLRILYGHAKRQWWYQNRRGWRPERDIVEEWNPIVDAVAQQDGQAAYDRLRGHIAHSRASLALGV